MNRSIWWSFLLWFNKVQSSSGRAQIAVLAVVEPFEPLLESWHWIPVGQRLLWSVGWGGDWCKRYRSDKTVNKDLAYRKITSFLEVSFHQLSYWRTIDTWSWKANAICRSNSWKYDRVNTEAAEARERLSQSTYIWNSYFILRHLGDYPVSFHTTRLS